MSLASLALVAAPLNLLWLWTVPYWPWLGDRLPLLLVLAGPLRWGVAALAIGGAVVRAVGVVVAEPAADRSVGLHRRPPRGLVFVVTLAIYLFFGLRSLSTIGLGGDEPHYLVITHSLLVDHDLQIENNHTRGDYRAFFGGDLRPDYLQRGVNGAIYSIHAPGLSALVLPGYALDGARGAIITVCVLAALAALAVFEVAAIVAGLATAWLTWAAVCFTVPFVPHAWALYPEMAGGGDRRVGHRLDPASGRALRDAVGMARRVSCHAALAAHQVRGPPGRPHRVPSVARCGPGGGRRRRSSFRLPSRAPRGSRFSGSFTAASIRRCRMAATRRSSSVSRTSHAVCSGCSSIRSSDSWSTRPIYLLLLPGFRALFDDRRLRLLGVMTALTAGAYVISSARLYMWWGGSSAPARFLVPVLPLLAPAVALGLTRVKGRAAMVTVAIAAAMSLAVAAAGAIGPGQFLLFSPPHGVARIVERLQGSAPLAAALPTFTQEEWRAPALQVLPWLAAVVLAGLAGWTAARRMASSFWIAAIELMVFAFVSAAAAASFPEAARAESATRGALAMLDAFDPVRRRAYDYQARAKLAEDGWLRRSTTVFEREAGSDPDPIGRMTDSLSLPPGRYEMRMWFQGDRPHDGALQAAVGLGEGRVLRQVDGPLANPAVLALDLPVPVPSLWVLLTDAASARAARRLEIRPLSLVPAGDRIAAGVRADRIASRTAERLSRLCRRGHVPGEWCVLDPRHRARNGAGGASRSDNTCDHAACRPDADPGDDLGGAGAQRNCHGCRGDPRRAPAAPSWRRDGNGGDPGRIVVPPF